MEKLLNQISSILRSSKLFDEDNIENILDFIDDEYNNDSDSDDDPDNLSDDDDFKGSLVQSLKKISENVKNSKVINLTPKTTQPIQNSSKPPQPQPQPIQTPSKPPQSQPIQIPQNSSLKPPQPQPIHNSSSKPPAQTGSVVRNVNDNQSVLLKTAVINNLNKPQINNTTQSVIQKIINFNVKNDNEKQRTQILNFGEQCKKLNLDPEIASNVFAKYLNAKKAYTNGVLILNVLETKDNLQSKFNIAFSKK